jgi:hypothetical protein
MAEPVGALRAILSLDWASFEEACGRAGKATNNFGKTFKDLDKDVKASQRAITEIATPIAAAMAAVGGAVLVATYKWIEYADQLTGLADKSGLTLEWLQATSFAAQQSGTDIEAVVNSTKTLQRALGEGSADTVASVQALGLSFGELRRASPDEQMQRVLVALGGVTNATERTTLAMRLLGKSGTDMIPLAMNIEALQRRAVELGLVMSDRDVRAADELGDSVEALGSAFGGLSNSVVAAITSNQSLHTMISGLTNVFGVLAQAVNGNREGMTDLVSRGVVFLANGLVLAVDAAQLANDVFGALQLTWKSAVNIALELALANERVKASQMAYTDATRAARAEAEQNVRLIQAEIAANAQSVTTLEQGDQRRTAAIQLVRGEMTNLVAAIEAVAGKEVALTGVRNQSTGAINLQSDASKGLVTQLYAMQDAEISAHNATVNLWLEANQAFQTLQADITEANLTGVDQRLFQIDRERQAAIASLQQYASTFPVLYGQMAAVATEKYRLMSEAAIREFFTPASNGMSAFAELSNAKFDEMLQVALGYFSAFGSSAISVYNQVSGVHARVGQADKEIDRQVFANRMNLYASYASTASQIIGGIFSHNKSTQIAQAIMDTASAIMRTMAQYGFPWGLIPAAAMAAMGVIQIHNIQSQDAGFAAGTPGTSFLDFGRATPTVLHGKEAVINQQTGRSLASMLAASIQGGPGPRLPGLAPTSGGATVLSDPELLSEMRGMNSALRRFIQAQPTVMRDAVMLAGA